MEGRKTMRPYVRITRERPQAPRAWRPDVRSAVGGAIGGVVAAYFIDPERKRARRQMAIGREPAPPPGDAGPSLAWRCVAPPRGDGLRVVRRDGSADHGRHPRGLVKRGRAVSRGDRTERSAVG